MPELTVTFNTPAEETGYRQVVAEAILRAHGSGLVTINGGGATTVVETNGTWRGETAGTLDGSPIGLPTVVWEYNGPVDEDEAELEEPLLLEGEDLHYEPVAEPDPVLDVAPDPVLDVAPDPVLDVAPTLIPALHAANIEEQGNLNGELDNAPQAAPCVLHIAAANADAAIATDVLVSLGLEGHLQVGELHHHDGTTTVTVHPVDAAGERMLAAATAGYFTAGGEYEIGGEKVEVRIGGNRPDVPPFIEEVRAEAAAAGETTNVLTVTYTRRRGGQIRPLTEADVEGILAEHTPTGQPGTPFGELQAITLCDDGTAVATFAAIDGAGDMVRGATGYAGALCFNHLEGDEVTAVGGVPHQAALNGPLVEIEG